MEGKIIKDDSIFSASMSGCSAGLHQRTKLAAHPGALPCWPLYRLKCLCRYPKKKKIIFLSQRHAEMSRAETNS